MGQDHNENPQWNVGIESLTEFEKCVMIKTKASKEFGMGNGL